MDAIDEEDSELLTIPEVAALLRLGLTKTYELVRCGAIRSVTIGRSRRVRPSDLRAYISDLS